MVLVPDAMIASYYNALVHIHNAADIPQRDSAIRCFTTPPAGPIEYRTQPFAIDLKKARWGRAWQKKRKVTGNATIDTLVARYGLTVDVTQDQGDTLIVTLAAPRPARMYLIDRILETIDGMWEPFSGAGMFDESEILSVVDWNSMRIYYRLGSFNCFNDKSLRERTWVFRVQHDGRVEYVPQH
jgi:hypothetical protein